jgi:Na+-driven multidrug efflux pump
MITPYRVSLVTASNVFFAVFLVGLLHHDVMNGHTLTPLEELPTALVVGVIVSGLALLGTWLGTRRGNLEKLTYNTGLAVALLYVLITFLADTFFDTGPRMVTIPSKEANIMGLEVLLTGTLWGVGVPYALALLVSWLSSFGKPNRT